MGKQTIYISGMTCSGCQDHLTKLLLAHSEIKNVQIELSTGKTDLDTEKTVSLTVLKKLIPEPYYINENVVLEPNMKTESLWPLALIFLFLTSTIILIHFPEFEFHEMMLDFMGGFFLVFSFFKFLDLKGFAKAFSVYDPLANSLFFYGLCYPFIELALAGLFIADFNLDIALIVSFVVLSITTVGVVKHLINKNKIVCACLGSVLNLPMTWATLIENAIMLIMILIYWFI